LAPVRYVIRDVRVRASQIASDQLPSKIHPSMKGRFVWIAPWTFCVFPCSKNEDAKSFFELLSTNNVPVFAPPIYKA